MVPTGRTYWWRLAAACACVLMHGYAREQHVSDSETTYDDQSRASGQYPSGLPSSAEDPDYPSYVFVKDQDQSVPWTDRSLPGQAAFLGSPMRTVSCNFEKSNCGILLLNGASWTSGSDREPGTPDSKPTIDHTTGTASGKFIFMDARDLPDNGERSFVLPLNVSHADRRPYCLEFAYDKTRSSRFNAVIGWSSKLEGSWQWPVFKTQTRETWEETQVTFMLDNQTKSFNWKVKVSSAPATGGYAVDDVRIADGSCSGSQNPINGDLPLVRCDFNIDKCSAKLENKVFLTDGKRRFNPYHPTVDTGMYAYLEVTGLNVGQSSALKQSVTPPAGKSSLCCLQLRYQLNGNGRHTFVVGLATPTSGDWEHFWTSDHKDTWISFNRTFALDAGAVNTFTLKAVTTAPNAIGGVALDDLVISKSACQGSEVPINVHFPFFGCSFDTGDCGAEFLHQASMIDSSTEPSNPYVPKLTRGRVAYLDATGLLPQQTSSLKVNLDIPSGPKPLSCVRVRYYLNGNNRHAFVLSWATPTSGGWEYIHTMDHKAAWVLWEDTFLLDAGVRNTFTLKAVATGQDPVGGVAIDYFVVDKNACIGSTKAINDALPVAACFFDPTVCEFFHLKKNAVLTSGTGSFIDEYKASADINGLKNGQYVYLHMQRLSLGEEAELLVEVDGKRISRRLHCFWFSYSSAGKGFYFDVSWKSGEGRWKPLYKETKKTSWGWKGMELIFELWKKTTIRFRAVASSSNPQGGVAIDNINLYGGRCNAAWDPWSDWTECDNQCNRSRSRKCDGRGVCEGPSQQTEACDPTTCSANRTPTGSTKGAATLPIKSQ